MKLSTRILIVLAVLIANTSCVISTKELKIRKESPSTNIIPKSFNIKDVTSLEFNGAFNVTYTQGSNPTFSISASDNIMDAIIVEQENGKVKLRMKKEFDYDSEKEFPQVTITSPVLESVVKAGMGKFTATNDIASNSFNITISGLSRAVFNNISCKKNSDSKISINCSGESDVKFSGELLANNITISSSGNSEVKGYKITGNNVSISNSGNSETNLTEMASVNASLNNSGSSEVDIKSLVSQTVKAENSGASSIDIENMDAIKFESSASGASGFELKGKCEQLNVSLSGSSKLEADKLIANNANIAASGVSVAECYVIDTLTGHCTTSSSIRYKNSPRRVEIK